MNRFYFIKFTGLLLLAAVLALPGVAWAKSSPGRFVVSADGHLVFDTRTHKTWQRDVPANNVGWETAKAYCKDNIAQLPGTGWHLPDVQELLTLVDMKETPTVIDHDAFPNTPADWFWSSTPYGKNPNVAWYVLFSLGNSHYHDITYQARARCVR